MSESLNTLHCQPHHVVFQCGLCDVFVIHCFPSLSDATFLCFSVAFSSEGSQRMRVIWWLVLNHPTLITRFMSETCNLWPFYCHGNSIWLWQDVQHIHDDTDRWCRKNTMWCHMQNRTSHSPPKLPFFNWWIKEKCRHHLMSISSFVTEIRIAARLRIDPWHCLKEVFQLLLRWSLSWSSKNKSVQRAPSVERGGGGIERGRERERDFTGRCEGLI